MIQRQVIGGARPHHQPGFGPHVDVLDRFHHPVSQLELKKRWNAGLYLDQPEEWDDPYRFFRW